LNEQHPARPGFYCYSESKQGAEDAVEGFRVAPMIARFVNVYGPGDRHFSRIVPKLLRCFARNEAVALTRGNGDTVLDYLYIDDAVDALIALASRGTSRRKVTTAEAFNFGVAGNNPVSVKQLARMASMAFDGRRREIIAPRSPVEPVMVKFLDPSKAKQVLGWSAKVRLEDGLTRTSAWYREHLDALAPLEDVVPVSFPLAFA
jgi:nucleoside-diphosphate-sugar epimerase